MLIMPLCIFLGVLKYSICYSVSRSSSSLVTFPIPCPSSSIREFHTLYFIPSLSQVCFVSMDLLCAVIRRLLSWEPS